MRTANGGAAPSEGRKSLLAFGPGCDKMGKEPITQENEKGVSPMKKILSLVLTLSLALSLCAPAMAAQDSMENFQKVNTYSNQFRDLQSGYWATPVVKLCYEYGFMYGDSPSSFNPQGNLTVAEAIVMADRIHEIYTTGQSTLTNGEPWYQTYVDYALEQGIVAPGDFTDYTAQVTRAQMAYIFCNALPASALPGINKITSLPDVNSGTPYAREIMTLYTAGVLTGNDVYGSFSPNNKIIRAEAAAILARVALPAQRQTVTLMKSVQWGSGVVVTVPQTAEADNSSGAETLLSVRDRAGAIRATDYNSAYQGISITALPLSMMNDLLSQGFASTGMNLVGAKSAKVSFGAIQAYRTTGTLSSDQGSADCVVFTYISGSTLQMIALLAYDNDAVLQTMANNLKVSGCTATPKL